ncbi:Membrane protein [Tenacibaculum sp. 190524A05c]|uniref:Membrane protein n=2 Tax=Tenacibaculum platacis TaxID=3137852 RepID=A0ABM9P412_9FLAO
MFYEFYISVIQQHMKPLIILLFSFTISIVAIKVFKKEYNIALSARIAMAIMLIFTAIGHFMFTKGMAMMIPKFLPFKESIVYFTGIFEILLAIGLLIPRFTYLSGWALLIFLVLMLPANIYGAIHNVNFQKGTLDGNGLSYLWFRVPLQVVFIIWTYFSSIRF